MKTDDLVTLLATGDIAIQPHTAAKRFALALGLGVGVAFLMMLGLLGLRPDFSEAIKLPMFWVKLGYAASLAAAALLALVRLSHPGSRLKKAPLGMALPIVLMWLLALYTLVDADSAQRHELLYGASWGACPLLITMLSAPIFLSTLWAVRGLAPTRLTQAGAAVGLLSGALGAVVYSLHCPEMGAPFIGTWYLLGMLIPTLIGATLGRSLLRW
ncbi:MAG: hypothetical protein B7Y40_00820 [Gammaproteobacteria bacterium 28-57-27]|nr:MAG: hypothetical protein B7Y40_00820 [Gammaproteobacteria bacterium 28-57-27]